MEVITVNFDPVANAQSNQEPTTTTFFEQTFDPTAAHNFGLSLLRGGVPTVP
jgi:hypothetical protein